MWQRKKPGDMRHKGRPKKFEVGRLSSTRLALKIKGGHESGNVSGFWIWVWALVNGEQRNEDPVLPQHRTEFCQWSKWTWIRQWSCFYGTYILLQKESVWLLIIFVHCSSKSTHNQRRIPHIGLMILRRLFDKHLVNIYCSLRLCQVPEMKWVVNNDSYPLKSYVRRRQTLKCIATMQCDTCK